MKTLFNHGNNISIKNNSNNCRGSRGSKDKTLGVSMLKDKLGRAYLRICSLIICTNTGSEVLEIACMCSFQDRFSSMFSP